MTTPKLSMPELSVSQASKEITHNQALAILDQLTQARVLDKDLAVPPGSPANGDAYIVAASPTGAWAGKAGQIAYWLTAVNAWSFAVPLNGWLVYVNDENKHYRRESGAWVELATGGGGGTIAIEDEGTPEGNADTLNFTGAGVTVTVDTAGVATVNIPGGGGASNATQSASSSGGVLNLSATTAPVILVTLTENITSITLPSGVANQTVERRIVFTQGGAGTYTIPVTTGAWGGIVVDSGATIPQMGTGVGTVGVYVLANDNNGTWRMYVDNGITTAQVGPIAGFRNLIINGNFSVNQRVYVSGAATTGANQYTLDRWRVVTSGQNLTFSVSGNGNQITAPAGGVEQVIEGANIAGGNYVLNWTGTATATVNGVSRAKGETFTLTANTNTTVRFTSGTVSQVQLEPGSVVTPFEERGFSQELILCQRYYQKSFNYATAPAEGVFSPWLAGFAWATTGIGVGFIPFQTRMRANPTIVFYRPSVLASPNGNWAWYNGATYVAGTVTTADSVFQDFGASFNMTVTGATTGDAYIARGNWTASAEL